MKVKIRYLSLFRDLTGKSEEYLEIPGTEATVKELLEEVMKKYAQLKSYVEGGEFIVVADGRPLQQNDKVMDASEVILMPPISGGAQYAFVEKIEPTRVLDGMLKALDDRAGAVVIFIGRVKGTVDGSRVNQLYYETIEPLSTSTLAKIGEEESQKHSLLYSTIYHKKGPAEPGEPVLFIGVASQGREEAIQALHSILERVKHEAYVWKLEKREDGEYWIIGDRKRVPRQASQA